MLFHITHVHTWESCPYHDPERAQATFGKAVKGIMESDVGLVGMYVDAPSHTTYLILDADSTVQIEESLAPVIDIGSAEVRPVQDFADIMRRVTAGDVR